MIRSRLVPAASAEINVPGYGAASKYLTFAVRNLKQLKETLLRYSFE
jgi:hypothetical protein